MRRDALVAGKVGETENGSVVFELSIGSIWRRKGNIITPLHVWITMGNLAKKLEIPTLFFGAKSG